MQPSSCCRASTTQARCCCTSPMPAAPAAPPFQATSTNLSTPCRGQEAVPTGYQYLIDDYLSNPNNPYPNNSFIATATSMARHRRAGELSHSTLPAPATSPSSPAARSMSSPRRMAAAAEPCCSTGRTPTPSTSPPAPERADRHRQRVHHPRQRQGQPSFLRPSATTTSSPAAAARHHPLLRQRLSARRRRPALGHR